MVGNDVVDLTDPETRRAALHPGFDARALAPSEIAALAESPAPDRLRWVLWAAKEAAYKAARQRGRAVFSPRRFVVTLSDAEHATVVHGDARWAVRLIDAEGGVHAIAMPAGEAEPPLVHAVRRLDGDRALRPAARALALDTVAPWLGEPRAELDIARDGRIPQLSVRGRPAPVALSLSHHGRMVAVACRALEVPR